MLVGCAKIKHLHKIFTPLCFNNVDFESNHQNETEPLTFMFYTSTLQWHHRYKKPVGNEDVNHKISTGVLLGNTVRTESWRPAVERMCCRTFLCSDFYFQCILSSARTFGLGDYVKLCIDCFPSPGIVTYCSVSLIVQTHAAGSV